MKIGSGSTAKFLRFSYDASGNAVAVDYSTDGGANFNTYYYLRNAQNDIVKIVDSTGSAVVEYVYDSWGKLIATTGSLANTVGSNQPFRYRGYVYDEETGFYYLQSRYYDPTTCRFISADVLLSTGQGVIGHNSFAYCNNSPILMTDSEGTFPFLAVTALIGAVVGAVVGGVIAAANGGDPVDILTGAAIGAAAGGLIGTGVGAATGIALAGSATASVASVAIGANALSTTVATAGGAAGGKMIADNVSLAFSNSPQVFWSGQDLAKRASRQVANEIGGKTLEMTRLGSYLEQSGPFATETWNAASANFANVAANSNHAIYSIQNSAGIGIDRTWATIEYPILHAKDIIYGIVFQDGSILYLK